jgi:hypothetical protein
LYNYTHGGFLGRVFQKDRNKKINDVVFLGTLGTFQNGILENILYVDVGLKLKIVPDS